MSKIKLFEEFITESGNTRSARDIINYVKDLTPSDSDHPDYFLSLVKKSGKSFVLKTLKVKDVIKMDQDVKSYVKSGEDRYGEYGESDFVPDDDDLDNPIVIFNGEVIDGYSRISTHYRKGIDNINAWVSE
jgi:hypothetical protein